MWINLEIWLSPLQWSNVQVIHSVSVYRVYRTTALSLIDLTEGEHQRYSLLYSMYQDGMSWNDMSVFLRTNNILTSTGLDFTPKRVFGVMQKVLKRHERMDDIRVFEEVIDAYLA